ncbi:MAG: hypothetical protein ABWY25_00540 [Paenisporosarcina sp.]
MVDTERLEERERNNIIAADVVDNELVLKRHDRTELHIPVGDDGGGGGTKSITLMTNSLFQTGAGHYSYLSVFNPFASTSDTVTGVPITKPAGGFVIDSQMLMVPPIAAGMPIMLMFGAIVASLDSTQYLHVELNTQYLDGNIPPGMVNLVGGSIATSTGTDLVFNAGAGTATTTAGGVFTTIVFATLMQL